MTSRAALEIYDRAKDVVDHAAAETLRVEIGAHLCRVVGQERAQIAICRAIIQVAGNLLAKLTNSEEAERFHRERAAHYCASAARAPKKWGERR